nr:hypothetical protein [Lactiplantibacillus plantarum]
MDISLLKQVVQSTNKIALSTAVNNEADVKIVNFVWYEAQPDTLYFSSVKTSPALKVYDQNRILHSLRFLMMEQRAIHIYEPNTLSYNGQLRR